MTLLFCPANDYSDVGGTTRYGYAKPKFVVVGDELQVTNVPVPERPAAFSAGEAQRPQGANLAFYDGHVESRHKSKVWIPEHAQQKPYQPGMWVVDKDLWQKNGGGL